MSSPAPQRQVDAAKLDFQPLQRLYQPPGNHGIYVAFTHDGGVRFFPETEDPDALARALAALVRFFLEHPSRIECAAGCHPHEAT